MTDIQQLTAQVAEARRLSNEATNASLAAGKKALELRFAAERIETELAVLVERLIGVQHVPVP